MRHLKFNYLNIGAYISIIYSESNSKKLVGIISIKTCQTLSTYKLKILPWYSNDQKFLLIKCLCLYKKQYL